MAGFSSTCVKTSGSAATLFVNDSPNCTTFFLERTIIATIRTDFFELHVKWVHCHNGMARPQVADGGDVLQTWRVTANIFNKQWRTGEKRWSYILGLGGGLTTTRHKITAFYEMFHY
jgi:hypothetical protein